MGKGRAWEWGQRTGCTWSGQGGLDFEWQSREWWCQAECVMVLPVSAVCLDNGNNYHRLKCFSLWYRSSQNWDTEASCGIEGSCELRLNFSSFSGVCTIVAKGFPSLDFHLLAYNTRILDSIILENESSDYSMISFVYLFNEFRQYVFLEFFWPV